MGNKSKTKTRKRFDVAVSNGQTKITEDQFLPPGYLPSDDSSYFNAASFFNIELNKKERKRLGGVSRKFSFEPKDVNSKVHEAPELALLQVGYSLTDAYQFACCFGANTWNGRAYAHQLTSRFSSLGICKHSNAPWTEMNFVTDWMNMKSLLSANVTNSRLSYIVHRCGTTVTIDHLDLTRTFMFPGYLELPVNLVQFLRDCLEDSLEDISKEGKSNKEVLAKEAYHKLLHATMKTPMVLNNSETSYLRYVTFSVGKYKILVGSNVPIYKDIDSVEQCTVLSSEKNQLSQAETFELWLDNSIHGCSNSYVFTQNDWKITKRSNYSTAVLSGKCTISSNMDSAEKLLKFLQQKTTSGSTYWLYRHPLSDEIRLLCLTTTMKRENPPSPLVEYWRPMQNFKDYFKLLSFKSYSISLRDLIADKLGMEMDFIKTSYTDKKLSASIESKFLDSVKRCQTTAVYPEEIYCQHLIQSPDQVSLLEMPNVIKCLEFVFNKLYLWDPYKIGWHSAHNYFPVVVRLCNSTRRAFDRFGHDFEKMKTYLLSLYDFVLLLLNCLQRDSSWVEGPEKVNLWNYFQIMLNNFLAQIISELHEVCRSLGTIPEIVSLERVSSIYVDVLERIERTSFPIKIPDVYFPKQKEYTMEIIASHVSKKLFQSYVSHVYHMLTWSKGDKGRLWQQHVVKKLKQAYTFWNQSRRRYDTFELLFDDQEIQSMDFVSHRLFGPTFKLARVVSVPEQAADLLNALIVLKKDWNNFLKACVREP